MFFNKENVVLLIIIYSKKIYFQPGFINYNRNFLLPPTKGIFK